MPVMPASPVGQGTLMLLKIIFIGACVCCNIFVSLAINFYEQMNRIMPHVSKRYLLLVAAIVWTIAGGILLFRGLGVNHDQEAHWSVKIAFCVIGGLLFYRALFDRISSKHVRRIQSMNAERPVIFAFFNLKSYLMMFSMITLGITLRLSGLVAPVHLALVYITMGIPLLMSSFRFYYTFFNF